MKGDPLETLEKNVEKKSHNAEKTERGDPLVSPGIVCYAGKRENLFGRGRRLTEPNRLVYEPKTEN